MVANLEETAIDGNVAAIDIEDDNMARGNADYRIPRPATQQMGAGLTDTRPSFRLQLCRRE